MAITYNFLFSKVMLKLRQIAYASIESTSRTPRWWILALVQAVFAFLVMPSIVYPGLLFSRYIFLSAGSVIILVPVTVWIWMDIDARKSRSLKQKSLKFFIQSCVSAGGIMFCALLATLAARVFVAQVVLFSLLSSLVTATSALAMLYAVLCEQRFSPAWGLALDTWSKKISLAAVVAFVLILAQAACFAFFHGLWDSLGFSGQFPVFGHSATIWILLFAVIFLAAFLGALLNCFLVFLFLETIRQKKDPEAMELAMPKQPVFEGNI